MHKAITDKILEAVDIVDVVGESVSLTRRGKEFIGLCPFHPDHRPSLSVSPSKQIFKCFACGAGGNAFRFVQLREKVGFGEAVAILARRAGVDLNVSDEQRQADLAREQIRQALVWARAHFQRNLRETAGGASALKYALQRGLSEETISRFGLGYAVDAWDDLLQGAGRAGLRREVLQAAGLVATNETGRVYDRFRHRLMFPICDGQGRCVAFGGRALPSSNRVGGEDSAKYLNSPETVLFSKSRILYGLDLARKAIGERGAALVVEGYLDAVLLHQHGFQNAVATLGTALTDAHVKLLRPLTDRLLLCFDGDRPGMQAADRAVEASLLGGMDVRVALLPVGTDPADCVTVSGAASFEKVLASAVEALEFKWQQTVKAYDTGGPAARRAAVEGLINFVAHLCATGAVNPVDQGSVVRRLSELLALPRTEVQGLLAAARRRVRSTGGERGVRPEALSGYQELIRGLPAGLVVAVEECFGLLLLDGRCAQWPERELAEAAGLCAVWSRLHELMRSLAQTESGLTRAAVIAGCDEPALCELVNSCCARVVGTGATAEALAAARERLGLELGAWRMEQLRRVLGRKDREAADAERAFDDLLAVARSHHSVLPAEKRGLGLSAT